MESYYRTNLKILFPYSTGDQIDEVITTVLSHACLLSEDENLEEMINLLVTSGDSSLSQSNDEQDDDAREQICSFNFHNLQSVFTDIDPEYLHRICQEHVDLDEVITHLTMFDYPKMVEDPMDLWDDLRQLLPAADPSYLKEQARIFACKPRKDLIEFVENSIQNNDYPSYQDYLIRQREQSELSVYKDKFSVEEYLKAVPDPLERFADPEYKSALADEANIAEEDVGFALNFLYNHFSYLRQKDILRTFKVTNMNLIKVFGKLELLPHAFQNPRKRIEPEGNTKNVGLLQEISFLQHKKDIKQFMKMKSDKYRAAFEEAKRFGLLETCACCYNDQLIPEECIFCNKWCTFCKDCVKTGAEIAIGNGQTDFPCLANCDSEFTLTTLQMILDRKIFQRLCQRKQMEDVKRANIDGLETCPFCDFSMIPAEGDKLFQCGNEECGVESCRECRHKSHVPYRCSEIEYDEDVKMRTYIENKMTAALLRTCWQCSKQFFKESGCNKMTCLCGAKMCYVCGQAVTDYTHFNRSGCPLYTDDLKKFHLNRVLEGAQTAKQEMGLIGNPSKLKFDPTRDIDGNIQ